MPQQPQRIPVAMRDHHHLRRVGLQLPDLRPAEIGDLDDMPPNVYKSEVRMAQTVGHRKNGRNSPAPARFHSSSHASLQFHEIHERQIVLKRKWIDGIHKICCNRQTMSPASAHFLASGVSA